ncbi:hypothetical protein Tsubulata_034395 [Turnera subulata]|uniref:Peptidase C1A papain C-terminal domain-containing protein n=1 Tax=Turnera subulata TaxID=218843 RepID=A0A9Q0J000_9ROSI|nr:hypothetical protein Tsubulata_034395 [Turnera subulata]
MEYTIPRDWSSPDLQLMRSGVGDQKIGGKTLQICWSYTTCGVIEIRFNMIADGLGRSRVQLHPHTLVMEMFEDYRTQPSECRFRTYSAFKWIKDYGLSTKLPADLPRRHRKRGSGPSHDDNRVHIHSLEEDESRNDGLLLNCLKGGPVAAVIPVDPAFHSFQGDGIYIPEAGGPGPNAAEVVLHAVMVVGNGVRTHDGVEFFKIKNSWGTAWGDHGFPNRCSVPYPQKMSLWQMFRFGKSWTVERRADVQFGFCGAENYFCVILAGFQAIHDGLAVASQTSFRSMMIVGAVQVLNKLQPGLTPYFPISCHYAVTLSGWSSNVVLGILIKGQML